MLPEIEAPTLEYSPFQARVLAVPEAHDLFLGGGRGGGKSYALAFLALRHIEQYGAKARILYIRKTFAGAEDFVGVTRELFGMVYGRSASFNQTSHVWTLPNGAFFEIGMLGDPSDYQRYQGRSFSLLLIDECGQFSDPSLLDLLRSNLRGSRGVPVRVALAANPGGVGHQWIARRYVFKASPWVPYHEEKSGREWVSCPSIHTDNPHLDHEDYQSQIEAATATDPELGRAWLEGDWTVARGAYFGSVIDESRNCIDPWPLPPWPARDFNWRSHSDPWELFLAYDHGSAAPAVCFIVARMSGGEGPDGRFYPAGSLVLVDELATCEPGSLVSGMRYIIPHLAEMITEMADRWGMKRPEGVADDACWARHGHEEGSIADQFSDHGVYFQRAEKGDRLSGWERMRTLLKDAGEVDVPGLYVSRSCGFFWATVPFLARDPRRVEDLDTRGPDHAADACRYALTWQKPIITTILRRR